VTSLEISCREVVFEVTINCVAELSEALLIEIILLLHETEANTIQTVFPIL